MSELLYRAQPYINYEEKLLSDKVKRAETYGKKDEKNRDEKTKKGPHGAYSEYTSLNTSREKILQECISTEFAEAEIRFPREIKEGPNS
ncbi:hypothetical protein A2U01_0004548 [Trifolium medium]|uniref:Uncharacterized protein n=1 Tax=Trifolium medium TaxID=97028 RepID=A0A392M8B8_9FABA|nr:hypothetical protein [Trifolium medium]